MPDKCQLTLLCHFSECTLSVSRFVLMFQRLCHKIAEWVSRSCFKCISGIISKLLVSQGKGYSGGQEKMLRRALGGNTHILTRFTSIYFKSILSSSIHLTYLQLSTLHLCYKPNISSVQYLHLSMFIFAGLWGRPRNLHSLEQLKYLHSVLSKNQNVTESNKGLLVETIRSGIRRQKQMKHNLNLNEKSLRFLDSKS